jgi:hypothetical protein
MIRLDVAFSTTFKNRLYSSLQGIIKKQSTIPKQSAAGGKC